VWLFGATSFLSAFLLFLIQPMYAKMLLPLLGGSPSVWKTALVFYQGALLLGYLWAHASARFGVRRHSVIHVALFALAFVVLPFGAARLGSPPVEGSPIPWMLATMAVGVGLPFFVVSAGAPLLQKWFSQTGHARSGDPYFLYVASNLGSMLALLSYPVIFEPLYTLGEQSLGWSIGFGALALTMAGCAWVARRGVAPSAAAAVAEERLEAPTWRRRVRWVLLAFVPSALLMGVTTFLTTDVGSVPMLWVGPLALYLATFIIAFARWQPIPHRLVAWLLAPLLVATLLVVLIPVTQPALGIAAVGVATFFAACWVCHGELAADRPSPRHLTEFYLWLSLGGVLGGAFCALVAPVAFNTVLEYSLVMVLCAALLPLGFRRPARPSTYGLDVLWFAVIAGAFALLIGFDATDRFKGLQALPLDARWIDRFFSFGLVGLAALLLVRRPVRFGLACAAILAIGTLMAPGRERIALEERSFFGVLRVRYSERGTFREFMHGTTLHGLQLTDPKMRHIATTYYHRRGPLGLVMGEMKGRHETLRVAAVGLGTGTIATYGRAGDLYNFYEIDPAVVRIARDPRFFTFVSDSPATFEFILGDARLSLARTRRQYDLIVLDAYSSDAVPLHLLTRDAVQVYLDRLAPGGVIAFHISNRHLNFEPVVEALCRDAGLVCRIKSDPASDLEDLAEGKYASEWVVAARSLEDLGELPEDARWRTLRADPRVRLWTDDFTNLLTILRL
jgi:spermidine synthase